MSASYRHPAFETPPVPPGWDRARGDLIRIVDPIGNAIAWLAPDFGAACVGYAVRVGGRGSGQWRHVFSSPGSPRMISAPDESGCVMLWTDPDSGSVSSGQSWQFIERDPISAVFATSIESLSDRRGLRLDLTMTATLENDALSLAVGATGLDSKSMPLPVHLAFRARFSPGVTPIVCDSKNGGYDFDVWLAFQEVASDRGTPQIWDSSSMDSEPEPPVTPTTVTVTFHPPGSS